MIEPRSHEATSIVGCSLLPDVASCCYLVLPRSGQRVDPQYAL